MLRTQQFQELTGTEYLLADIACKMDKKNEKEHWDVRIAEGKKIVESDAIQTKKASNPIGLTAAIEAYKKTRNQQATGYALSLDAASSGLQLLSLLVSCPKSWRLCGGDENILDAYTHIYGAMQVGNFLQRGEVKDCIMTALYGSTATPKSYFGDKIEIFYETMEDEAPGAWDLNMGIQELWNAMDGNVYDWYLPDGFYACIETCDKEDIPFIFYEEEYLVTQKVNQRPRFHKGLGPNLIHSVDGMIVREMGRRCMFNPEKTVDLIHWITHNVRTKEKDNHSTRMVKEIWEAYKQSGFLTVRILDYLLPCNLDLVDVDVIAKLLMTLPDKPFDILAVHDCFRCHPNYGNDLRRQYNNILADINDSNMLTYITSQVLGKPVNAKKTGHIPRDVILNGNYTLG